MKFIQISITLLIASVIGQNLVIAQSSPQINDLTASEQMELQQLRQEKLLQSQLRSHRWEWITALIVFWITFSFVSILGFWRFERHLLQKMSEILKSSFHALESKYNSFSSVNSGLELDQFISLAEFSNQVALLEAKIHELQQELTATQGELQQEISQLRFDFNQLNQSYIKVTTPEDNLEIPPEVLEPEPTHFSLEDYLKEGDLKYAEQDYIEATIAYNKALKMNPDLADVRYKNACSYAIIGRTNPAIGNLQWAIDLDSEYRIKATQETAFDSLRFDSQFKQLVNAEEHH